MPQANTLGLYSAFRACKAMALRSNLQSKFTVETMFLDKKHNTNYSLCNTCIKNRRCFDCFHRTKQSIQIVSGKGDYSFPGKTIPPTHCHEILHVPMFMPNKWANNAKRIIEGHTRPSMNIKLCKSKN